MVGAILEHQKLANGYLQQLAMVLKSVPSQKIPGGFYAVFRVFSLTEKEQTKESKSVYYCV